MRTPQIVLDVFLVVFGVGVALLYPQLIKCSRSWQIMAPHLRILLMIGWQVFILLLAVNALIALFIFTRYVSPSLQHDVTTWLDRLGWVVFAYIGVLTLFTVRQAPQRSLDVDPRWGIVLVVSVVALCLVIALFARSPLSLPVR